jgi:hypothetical protein
MSQYLKLFKKAHGKVKQIENSPGHQILNDIKGLKNSVYIYRENFRELEKILDQFRDVDFATDLVSERYSTKREKKIREFLRVFHNFILSVKSLVAHARNFMNKSYQETQLYQDYNRKIENNFKKDNEVIFLEKLRNYFCHYRLPKFKTKITIDLEENSETSNIKLLKKDLLEFSGWGNSAKKYISNCPKEINVRDIIYRYKNSTDELYSWLFQKIEKLHSEELKRTRELIEEYETISDDLSKLNLFKSK